MELREIIDVYSDAPIAAAVSDTDTGIAVHANGLGVTSGNGIDFLDELEHQETRSGRCTVYFRNSDGWNLR